VAFVLGLLAFGVWVDARLVAAGLLLRFEGGTGAPAWIVHYAEQPVVERVWRLPDGQRGRLYVPEAPAGGAVLLLHGMHEDGVDEKRLVNFARAIASTGLVVGTPELAELRRFRMTWADVGRVARAAELLAVEVKRRQVTVFGISFGGGLALRAACDGRRAASIGRVIALGAPHDLVRVARFVLGHKVAGPAGEIPPDDPHPYARKAMKNFLLAEPPKQEPSNELLEHALERRAAELRELSPTSCRAPISADVHLAHGLGDRIIPYTETLWLARTLPVEHPAEVLVSPVIVHAEYAEPTLWQRFQLVNFMANATRR
jgi:pimeloyl-ACP methyl ester carboxylesterase